MADFSQVQAKQGEADRLGKAAVEYGARGNTLADELRKAVGERFGESNIAQGVAQARGDFLSASSQQREKTAGLVQDGGYMFNPSQIQSMRRADRSAALVPLMGANLMQDITFGSMEDIIGAGTNAWNAQTQNLSGLAQLAQGSASNLMTQIMNQANLDSSEAQLAIQQAQEGRAAELHPYDIQQAQANISKANRTGLKDEEDDNEVWMERADDEGNIFYDVYDKTTGKKIRTIGASEIQSTPGIMSNLAEGVQSLLGRSGSVPIDEQSVSERSAGARGQIGSALGSWVDWMKKYNSSR